MIPKSFDEHESHCRLGDDAMLSYNAMQRFALRFRSTVLKRLWTGLVKLHHVMNMKR